jgi:hypothetical protein
VEFGDLVQRISESVSFPLLSAFLIGVMAAISPCPLATNITAMAYISRRITDRRYVISSGALYTLGRITSYFIIGALVITAGTSIPRVSLFLQDVGERYMGPLLIVVGILLLGIIKLPLVQSGGKLASLGERVAKRGRLGAYLLGVVFALVLRHSGPPRARIQGGYHPARRVCRRNRPAGAAVRRSSVSWCHPGSDVAGQGLRSGEGDPEARGAALHRCRDILRSAMGPRLKESAVGVLDRQGE